MWGNHFIPSGKEILCGHDDDIKRKHFPRYWPFVQGIHRSPVNSLHEGQWHRTLMLSLICTQINSWVNNGGAGDLRHHRAHFDVTVIIRSLRLMPATDLLTWYQWVLAWMCCFLLYTQQNRHTTLNNLSGSINGNYDLWKTTTKHNEQELCAYLLGCTVYLVNQSLPR